MKRLNSHGFSMGEVYMIELVGVEKQHIPYEVALPLVKSCSKLSGFLKALRDPSGKRGIIWSV